LISNDSVRLPRFWLQRIVGTTFIALRNRNFKLYFYGQLVSNTGNWLTNVAITLLVLKITHSGFDVGILAAFQYGPILLLSAWAGAITDRVDKHKFLLLTQSLEMAESVGLAILAFTHPSLYALFGLAFIGGALLAFDNPLRRSFVSDMVPKEDVPNAVILYSLIVNTSRIFGPTLAGLFVVTLGYGWCFTIDALSYLAVIGSLLRMRVSEFHLQPHAARMKGEVRAGLRYVRSVPHLWVSFVMLAFIGSLSYNFAVTLPLFVTDSLHQSSSVFTILYAVFSLGAVVSGLIVARRNMAKINSVITGALTFGIALLLFSIAPNLYVALPLMFFVGMTTIIYMTSTTSIIQIEADPAMRGRVLSLQTVLLIGTTPIGAPLLGVLADRSGGRAPLVVGAVVALAAAAFGFSTVRKFKAAA
jgi:MFS family permease